MKKKIYSHTCTDINLIQKKFTVERYHNNREYVKYKTIFKKTVKDQMLSYHEPQLSICEMHTQLNLNMIKLHNCE